MIEDDGGFMRRETAREWQCDPSVDLITCPECDNFMEKGEEVCTYCEECDDEYDGQPDEYTEWQDYMGGDDWDYGQYDEEW